MAWPRGSCNDGGVNDRDSSSTADREAATAELEAAALVFADAQTAVETARAGLADAMVTAARCGVRQTRIVQITGYTREHIRRIVRAADVDAAE